MLVKQSTMADLSGLPFPPAELSWEKLPIVMDHLGLGKQAACAVLNLVLGAPSVPECASVTFHR